MQPDRTLSALALTAALLFGALAGCGDDGDDTACEAADDCVEIQANTDPRIGDFSVGVGNCGDGTCRIWVFDDLADEEVSSDRYAEGDTVELGEQTWEVVEVDGDGLTLRRM